jgi:hypothetical protein
MRKIILAMVMCLIPVISYAAEGVLTWTPNTEVDLAGYRVYFAPQSCTAQGPLAPLMVGGVAVQVGKVSTYTHINLPNIDGTLCWEITAIDTSGNESMHSVRVTKVVNLIPPVAPVGLTVTVVP